MSLELIRLPYAPGNLEPLTITFRHERFNYDQVIGVMAEFQRSGQEPWRHAIRAQIEDHRFSRDGYGNYGIGLSPASGRNLSEGQLHELRWRLMNEYIAREDRRGRR